MKILFPSDFSYNANAALMFAAEVCKFSKGQLVLINAVHVPMVDSGAVPIIEEMMDGLRESAEKNMKGLQQLLKNEHGLSAETRIEFGFAADVIADAVRQFKPDLVIMGTKGVSNVVDRIFGSITAEVMKRVDAKLMIIPQHALYSGFEKIAVATGLETDDIDLALEVRAFCARFNPKITLVHIDEKTDEEEKRNTFKRAMSEKMPEAQFERFYSDSVAEGLDDYVDLENMQLLAIRKQKRSFIETLLHHSITKDLAYHSKVPVLVY